VQNNNFMEDKNMKKGIFSFVIMAVFLLVSPLCAANPDAIVGKWWNQEKTSQIEIYKYHGTYAGKIVWLKNPLFPADDPKGMGGQTRVDRENPDPASRTKPLLGMIMVWGFTFSGGDLWENGFIYDPRDGKTYKCKMTLKSADILDVRGFIGVSLFGKTNTWTRVK
jgi:uncharacterized protein (DUF2147 family)